MTERIASITSLLLLLLGLATDSQIVAASNEQKPDVLVPGRRPQFVHKWSVADGGAAPIDLEARIVQEDRKPTSLGSLVQVYRQDKLVYSFDPGLYPEYMLTLTDGNLAVLWSHADGAFTLDVFAFKNGKVHNVLEASGGKMRPEFVYQSHAHLMGEAEPDKSGKLVVRGGPFFQQRIIFPLTDWTPSQKAYLGYGHHEYLPLAADIYTWDDSLGKYRARRKVPWNERLRGL